MSELKITNENLKHIRLSQDVLKFIAAALMLIDHSAFGLLHAYLVKNAMSILPQTYTKLNNLYGIGRNLGRLAMPIFAFFVVEGFIKTSNLRKYILRLFVFAVISEVPFDLGLYNSFFYTDHQNVLFTFLISLLMLAFIEWMNKTIVGLSEPVKWFATISAIIAFADVAYMLKTDYSYKGVLLIAVIYLLRECGIFRLVAGAGVVAWEKFAPLSFLLLYFYDPDRKPKHKYFFYLFYPLHLLLIYFLAQIILF